MLEFPYLRATIVRRKGPKVNSRIKRSKPEETILVFTKRILERLNPGDYINVFKINNSSEIRKGSEYIGGWQVNKDGSTTRYV